MLFDMGGEQFNDLADKASQIVQCWDQRFTLDNRRFVERYLNAELRVLVHVRRQRLGGDTGEGRALFEAVPRDFPDGNRREDHRLVLPGDGHLVVEDDRSAACPDGEEQPMLVDYVKLAESPQTVIPSRVRFEPSDSAASRSPDSALYLSKTGFRLGPTLEDWECIGLARRLPIHLDQTSIEQIERRPEVVDGVPSYQREARRESHANPEAVEQVSRIRLYLADDFVGVAVVKPLDLGYEIADVLIGPLNLGARAIHPSLPRKRLGA